MWWEGTYQAIIRFHHGLTDVLLQFAIQFLVFTAQTRAPRKLRKLVNSLLTKVASVRPEKERAGTPALPLRELLWVLSKDFGTEHKRGD